MDSHRPLADDLLAALMMALVENDSYRIMLDLPMKDVRRTFSETDLNEGRQLGGRAMMQDGALTVWMES